MFLIKDKPWAESEESFSIAVFSWFLIWWRMGIQVASISSLFLMLPGELLSRAPNPAVVWRESLVSEEMKG